MAGACGQDLWGFSARRGGRPAPRPTVRHEGNNGGLGRGDVSWGQPVGGSHLTAAVGHGRRLWAIPGPLDRLCVVVVLCVVVRCCVLPPERNSGPLHVRTSGDQHKSADRKRARQWPTRPEVPFSVTEDGAVDRPPTVARQWIHSSTSMTPASRDALERGVSPPPLQGAQPMPSHCPPDGKCQLQMAFVTDSNRPQPLWQPTSTACSRLLGPPLGSLPF